MDQEEGRKLFVPSTKHRNRIHSLPMPLQRKGREELQEEGTVRSGAEFAGRWQLHQDLAGQAEEGEGERQKKQEDRGGEDQSLC